VAQETGPYDFRSRQSGYFGPEAEVPEPRDLEEILVAYFGPEDPDHPQYGGFWTALQIAERKVNQQGGYRGIPIRILPVWTEDPWAGGISDMVKAFYEKQVWALIGSVDSASTHLLEQISAKIRVPVLNPASTDKSANLANVPWFFSLLPGDHILAGQLAGELEKRIQDSRSSFVLISSMDHDSRLFAREFKMLMSEKKLVPDFIFEFDPDIPLPWERLKREPVQFVVIASPPQSALLVREIRARYPDSPILGSPFMGRNSFRAACGGACRKISYISPGMTALESEFSREFARVTGRDPDYAECSTYDALILLHQSLLKSGLNRVRLMEEIRKISPWESETGVLIWDPLGQNTRQGTIQAIEAMDINSPG